MRSKQWESRGKQTEPTSVFNLTLAQFQDVAAAIVLDLIGTGLHGETLTPTKSGDSSQQSAVTGAVLFWAQRATAALCQLQSWTRMNEYATTLQIKRLLETYTLGQYLVMEIYSAVAAALACEVHLGNLNNDNNKAQVPETD